MDYIFQINFPSDALKYNNYSALKDVIECKTLVSI